MKTNKKYNFVIVGDTIEFAEIPEETETYVFNKNEWNIVEGVVSNEIALINREQINASISFAHTEGFTIFEVGELNAYFEIGAVNFGNLIHREAIQIPSNFHFKMSDNTFLRVQPTDQIAYGLLSARSVDNVTISGGNLMGDKYEHTYATGTQLDTHEFGFGIYLVGVTNSTVDNVYIDNMTGDCVAIHSTGSRFDDGSENPKYDYSKNIEIRDCVFKGSRRNNLSFIDIDGLLLENCIIEGAGEGGSYDYRVEGRSWKGVSPRCGIDLEATRSWNSDTQTPKYSQVCTNIVIRNNKFTNSFGNDINLFTCSNVEIYDNELDSSIETIFLAQNIEIYRNNIIASTYEDGHIRHGISAGGYISPNTGEQYVTNFKIYENNIDGFEIGISVGGDNQHVYSNQILNSLHTGVKLASGNNIKLNNNIITSDVASSKGYYQSRTKKINGLTLIDENVKADYYGLLFKGLKSNDMTVIDNCSFSAGFRNIDLRNTENLTLKNSAVGVIHQSNNTNIILENNN